MCNITFARGVEVSGFWGQPKSKNKKAERKMKNSTVWWTVGALVLTATMAVMYLCATTDFDRRGEQVAVATVSTEATVETAKEVVPETNKIVKADFKPVVVTGTVAGKFTE